MPLSSELKKFMESLSCCTYNGSQHTEILIKEDDTHAKLKKATVHMGEGDWFSFCPDKGRGNKKIMSPLLTCKKEFDHHRACDCVIIVCKSGKLDVIYIDLKSENPVGYANQFKSTKQFVYYAIGLLHEFGVQNLQISREHYIILYGGDIPIRKRRTSPETNRTSGLKPDDAYKLRIPDGEKVYVRQLLSH